MLPARDMVMVEDIGEDVLPHTTEDGENFPQGARKTEQAGLPALLSVMSHHKNEP